MDVRQPIHSDHAKQLDAAGLRRHFLVDPVFVPGEVALTYSQIDRIVVGGAMPLAAPLGFAPELAKQFAVGAFLERRELGAINVGGPGSIVVDGETCASAAPIRRARRSSTSTARPRTAPAARGG
jgi:4-deoxy-L-threo-5-hexosulose-uronate ketol-isomerase